MQTVGFIGLGKMGGPVATRIQESGFPMVVFDLDEAATRPFLERGARLASSAAEVASLADVTFTAVPMPKDVEAVAIGREGIVEGIREDGVYVDISTSSPLLFKKLEPHFLQKNAWLMDAPVGAGQPGFEPGVHEIMVGGDRAIYERIKPVFAAYGDQIVYAGELGSGAVCKLMHQMIGCGVSQAVAEGMTLGAKAGVRPEVVWEAVRRGLVGRMHIMHEQIPQQVFPGRYEPALFTLSLLRKDLGLATELGRHLNVPLPLSSLVEQIAVQAMNRGFGNGSGYTVTFQLQEEAAGVNLRASVDAEKAARYISTRGDAEIS
jgi:3-hydroxyisobutyrate dehydrogenase